MGRVVDTGELRGAAGQPYPDADELAAPVRVGSLPVGDGLPAFAAVRLPAVVRIPFLCARSNGQQQPPFLSLPKTVRCW
jgi:hypothetical protein